VGIDRLGRNAAEVMTTIRELRERGIVLQLVLLNLNWNFALDRSKAALAQRMHASGESAI
jgi:DNA invertase Pin-like site-specific DNA recombinase